MKVEDLTGLRVRVDLRENRLVSHDPLEFGSVEITDPRLEDMIRDQQRAGD